MSFPLLSMTVIPGGRLRPIPKLANGFFSTGVLVMVIPGGKFLPILGVGGVLRVLVVNGGCPLPIPVPLPPLPRLILLGINLPLAVPLNLKPSTGVRS